jgi:hypothetical protein
MEIDMAERVFAIGTFLYPLDEPTVFLIRRSGSGGVVVAVAALLFSAAAAATLADTEDQRDSRIQPSVWRDRTSAIIAVTHIVIFITFLELCDLMSLL